ncbi:MAG: WG repeat-containing protein [Leptospiraceae bacterium]|nr:WG repeat-containing protein [Leptospiraceae bacterium]
MSKIARAKKDKDGKFGYVNEDYKPITEFEYDYVYNFVDGHGVVYKNKKYSVIDSAIKEVLSPQTVNPANMDIGDEYDNLTGNHKSLITYHKSHAREFVGTTNWYSVRYDKESKKFVIFPEFAHVKDEDYPKPAEYEAKGFRFVGPWVGEAILFKVAFMSGGIAEITFTDKDKDFEKEILKLLYIELFLDLDIQKIHVIQSSFIKKKEIKISDLEKEIDFDLKKDLEGILNRIIEKIRENHKKEIRELKLRIDNNDISIGGFLDEEFYISMKIDNKQKSADISFEVPDGLVGTGFIRYIFKILYFASKYKKLDEITIKDAVGYWWAVLGSKASIEDIRRILKENRDELEHGIFVYESRECQIEDKVKRLNDRESVLTVDDLDEIDEYVNTREDEGFDDIEMNYFAQEDHKYGEAFLVEKKWNAIFDLSVPMLELFDERGLKVIEDHLLRLAKDINKKKISVEFEKSEAGIKSVKIGS